MRYHRLNLKFKGDRDYLHGSDIFDALLRILEPKAPTSLRLHRLMRHPVSVGPLSLSSERPAGFFFHHDGSGVRHELGIYEQSDSIVEGRVAYDEDSVGRGAVISDHRIDMQHRPEATFIERILVMNKLLHRSLFSGARGRWLFSRVDFERLPEMPQTIGLEYQGGVGTRLTKVNIETDGIRVGTLFFTLVPA